MIDTLKIILADSIISSKNKFIIMPSPVEINTGLLVNDWFLFIDSQRKQYYGSRAYYNDERVQVTILNKYALLAEKDKDLTLDRTENDEGNTKIIVQLSLPKFFNGNNFKSTNLYDLKKHLKKIEKYLNTIGIYTNILDANLSRLDTFLNLPTKYSFKSYNQILSNLRLSRLKNFEYAGTTFLYKNTQHQICIYDKIKELENQNINLNIKGNFVRIENRLLKKKKILDSLGYFKVSDLENRLSEIKENYETTISNKIFSINMDTDNNLSGIEDKRILTKENLENYLLQLKKNKGRNYIDSFIKNVGLLYLQNNDKLNNLSDAISDITKDRRNKNRILKKIDDNLKTSKLFEQSNNLTNKDLYDELRATFEKELKKIDL